ncbi:PIR Superfamily Protein [Plasmodium ovale curtisi]|uniref:PIR Superfamily Protein n=1 Tax=Plasmodium ovale curtisi TaxID=864141 RepID=A0A1A8X8Y1_PLAOA|nr:PIR Superfamily Protein [Plasmodium ovale curtisi]
MATATPHDGSGGFLRDTSVELHTEKFYEELNSESPDLSSYSLHCNNVYVNNNRDEVKKVCTKFLRHLDKSLVWNVENPGYDFCMLLNYWIHDKLSDLFGDNNTSDTINSAFGTFQFTWEYNVNTSKNKTYYKNCKPEYNIVKQHDWKKRKEFYEYYVDFDVLHSMAKNYDDDCKYYKQIEGKKSLYKYFEELYLQDNNNYPDFHDKYKDKNPESVLPQLRCHTQILAQKAAEKSTEPELGSETHQHGPKSGVSETAFDPRGKVPTPEKSDIGTKVGHSVLGVAPVLLTATALYRYTPIGSWVRKLGGYSPNSMNDMDGYSTYTEESGDMLFDRSANYISYQPM